MKAGYDARERARKEKEREREEREAEERREEEERDRDLTGWASKMRKEHEVGASEDDGDYRQKQFAHLPVRLLEHHDQNKRAQSSQGCTERQEECCFSSPYEEHCESGR